MTEMENKIGTDAGLVWKALDKSKKPLTIKELKTKSGVRTEREVYTAIGWLAKEGKLDFTPDEKNTFKVSLK